LHRELKPPCTTTEEARIVTYEKSPMYEWHEKNPNRLTEERF